MEIALLQSGRLYVASPLGEGEAVSVAIDPDWVKKIEAAFDDGSVAGILELATHTGTTDVSASVKYWREFGQLFLSQLCAHEAIEEPVEACRVPTPDKAIRSLSLSVPPLIGGENVTVPRLESLWEEMNLFLLSEAKGFAGTLRDFIGKRFPFWVHVGRVYFHLAENRKNPKMLREDRFAGRAFGGKTFRRGDEGDH